MRAKDRGRRMHRDRYADRKCGRRAVLNVDHMVPSIAGGRTEPEKPADLRVSV